MNHGDMKMKRLLVLVGVSCALASIASAGTDDRPKAAVGLVQEVRLATREFRDVNAAIAAGYGSLGSCVTGPERGAMGVHFANGALVGDGALDASRPELLLYEQRGGRLRLLGVEFLVIAADWHAGNAAPPVLMGQHFQYVGSPNRYGLPPFYELHVWAWRDNAFGTFVDWNPEVSCDEYTGHDGH
jgi:hypothetical protein